MSAAPTRTIGKSQVHPIGYGAMGLAAFYGEAKTQEQVNEVFDFLISQGVQHIDTSDIYSSSAYGKLGQNEEQIGNYLKAHPEARSKLFLATKHVFTIEADGSRGVRGGRDYAHEALNASLKRLNTDHVDLFYTHRPVDAEIESSIQGMKELQQEGKLKYIGVSEYNVQQLERAEKIAHIDALQIELSPTTPDILSNGIFDWCVKNGTTVVAYSPLGRGLLSGNFDVSTLKDDDFRKNSPRFQAEHFEHNVKIVDDLKSIASSHSSTNATAGQIALAWVLAQGQNVVVIPGSTKTKNIAENVGAGKISLSKEEKKELDDVILNFKVKGDRYPPAMARLSAF